MVTNFPNFNFISIHHLLLAHIMLKKISGLLCLHTHNTHTSNIHSICSTILAREEEVKSNSILLPCTGNYYNNISHLFFIVIILWKNNFQSHFYRAHYTTNFSNTVTEKTLTIWIFTKKKKTSYHVLKP